MTASVQLKINRLLLLWQNVVDQYRTEGQAAAQAAAEYKRERAKFIVAEKARDPRAAATIVEARADADDTVSSLYLQRLATEAALGSTQYMLIKLRAEADALRTELVDERASNALYTHAGPGA